MLTIPPLEEYICPLSCNTEYFICMLFVNQKKNYMLPKAETSQFRCFKIFTTAYLNVSREHINNIPYAMG